MIGALYIIMTFYLPLFAPLLVIISLLTKSGRVFWYTQISKMKLVSLIVGIALLHAMFSFVIFGFEFALGESGHEHGLFPAVLSYIDVILHVPFFSLVLLIEHIFKFSFPDSFRLFLSFVADPLFWGITISWYIKRHLKRNRTEGTLHKGTGST